MSLETKYAFRLRVFLSKPFTSSATGITLTVAGRDILIRSQKRDQVLSETRWIVLRSGGFDSEAEAREFGERLRRSTELVGLCCRLGIDVGHDNLSSMVSEKFVREIGLVPPDVRIFPNIHGITILPDDEEKNRVIIFQAEGKTTANPDQFSEALIYLSATPLPSLSTASAIRILNLALLNPEPMARVVLAISAIEALGQTETWTAAQVGAIEALAAQIENSTELPAAESSEVASGLRRGLFRLSLRQGVLRVLESLGLKHLKAEWDRVYALRSSVFHGAAAPTDANVGQLAHDTITLCGQIILTAVLRDGVDLPTVARLHYRI